MRVTQFDKSGDYISHTRRDCVQRSPSDDAKPNSGEVRPNQKCIGCAIRMKSADGAEMIREEERRCCRSEKGHFARVRHMSAAVDRYEHESFSLKDYRVLLSLIQHSETSCARVRMVERAKQHYIP